MLLIIQFFVQFYKAVYIFEVLLLPERKPRDFLDNLFVPFWFIKMFTSTRLRILHFLTCLQSVLAEYKSSALFTVIRMGIRK